MNIASTDTRSPYQLNLANTIDFSSTHAIALARSNEPFLVEKGKEYLLFDASGRWRRGDDTERSKRLPLKSTIASLFVPTGYPDSVSSDYIAYQLFTLPTHITGWVSISLATGSLLKAVGVAVSPLSSTALAAAIKWITKDGVGALGRLFVGGRLGTYIDEDPRLWRMTAESISTIGLSLEIATVFFPTHFLLLAGTGNFTKALAKGISKPSFRVIQQHFARSNNIGEVSAKEESWEVAGQLTGLLLSISILSSLQDASDWQPILTTWMGMQSVHVICRYLALNALEFDVVNLVRAKTIISAFLMHRTVPTPDAVAAEENFMTDWITTRPRIHFGTSLKRLQIDDFSEWVDTFQDEDYLLWLHSGEGHVVLKTSRNSLTCLKALWQYLWLENEGWIDPDYAQLKSSLQVANTRFEDFCVCAGRMGWRLDSCVFRTASARVETRT